MNRRKKNNILIGVLCCALVFMGIGYAVLNATLSIGATANITGDFDIHFYSIERSASSISDSTILSTIDNGTGITNSPTNTTGQFTAVLQKPGDYVTYDVVVKNTGSIDGYLTFSFGDTNNNFDYYDDFYSVEFIRDDTDPDIIADILQNQTFTDSEVLVKTSGTRTYKIKVTYKSTAESFPDVTNEGAFGCTMNLTYSQQAPSQGGGNTPTQVSSEGWIVNNQGRVTSSPPPSTMIQNGTLRIPAVDENGNNIVSIGVNSFEPDTNVTLYIASVKGDKDSQEVKYAIITDQTNYSILSSYMQKLDINVISSTSEIIGDYKDPYYYNLDTTIPVNSFTEQNMTIAKLNITTLDLSSATHLTTIDSSTFKGTGISTIIFNTSLSSIEQYAFSDNAITSLDLSTMPNLHTIGYGCFENNSISSLTIPPNITTIGHFAFYYNSITSLTIPSTVTSIGGSAFAYNGMTSLDLTHATGLTQLTGFNDNNLTSISIPANVTSIENNAFSYNYISSLTIPSSVTTIRSNAFSKNNLTSLNLTNATGLTTISESAFQGNNIGTLDLSNTGVTTIGSEAFVTNSITTITLPSSISNIGAAAFDQQEVKDNHTLSTINIPMTKSNFENNVTVGEDWFDYKGEPSLVYSDVTETCVPSGKSGYTCS